MPATKKRSYARPTLAAAGLLGRMIALERKGQRITLQDLRALSANGEYYIRVRARDSLPRGFSLWPFGRPEVSGRAELPAGR